MEVDYKAKYQKYKSKYVGLKFKLKQKVNQYGGDQKFVIGSIDKYRRAFGAEKVDAVFDPIFKSDVVESEEQFQKKLFNALEVFQSQMPVRKPPTVLIKKDTALWHASVANFTYPEGKAIFFATNFDDLKKYIIPFINWYTKSTAIYVNQYKTKVNRKVVDLTADYSLIDLERYIRSLEPKYVPSMNVRGVGNNQLAAGWLSDNHKKFVDIRDTVGWLEHKESLVVSQMDEIMIYGGDISRGYLELVSRQLFDFSSGVLKPIDVVKEKQVEKKINLL